MNEIIKSRTFLVVAMLLAGSATATATAIAFGLPHPPEDRGFYTERPEWTIYLPRDFPLGVEPHIFSPEGESRWLENPDPAYEPVAEAIRRFNEEVGFIALMYAGHHEDGLIEVMIDDPSEARRHNDFNVWSYDFPGGGGSNQYYPSIPPANHTCIAFASSDTEPEVETRVLLHDFGHCLGLDHDTDPRSIMDLEGPFSPDLARFTDPDRSLLRRTYRR